MLTEVEIISQWINDSRLRLIDSQLRKGLKASGKSAESLQTTVAPNFGQLIDKAGYFYFQEFGRKAGKAPPVKALYDWLQYNKYGITYKDDKERMSIAYGMQQNIRLKGTYTHQHGSTNVVSDVFSKDRIASLTESFAKMYGAKAKSDIVSEFKPKN